MSSSLSFPRLTQLFSRPPSLPAEILDPYTAIVLPVLERADVLYQQWFEHTIIVSDSEKLANAAAIQRWQAATMARALEHVTPPAELSQTHHQLVASLQQASRASQLLSSGSRYHNANALCEGQVLLTDARTRRLKAQATLRRVLAKRRPPVGATGARRDDVGLDTGTPPARDGSQDLGASV